MSSPAPVSTDDPGMADVHSPFQFNTALHKRKQRPDDLNDDFFNHDAKRRSIHCLPIRSSPSRNTVGIPPVYSPFTSIYQQPPTPVDTSDDESPAGPKEHHWRHKDCFRDDAQDSSDSSTASLTAQCGESVDVDMDSNMTMLSQPRIRRARSNDIMPPHRSSSFLGALDNLARERVPTPISSHFDNRVNDLPTVPRHQFPPLRTNLSPMFEQDSWITRDGLPSPVEDHEMDGMMVDATNDDMSGQELTEPQLIERYGLQVDGQSSPGRARTGRLHMGFLNGCEKCMQKVPGHYSHILWS